MTSRRYLTPKAKTELWERQGRRCAGCPLDLVLSEVQADHIQPLWCGGSNSAENWQLLCRTCHSKKTFRQEAGARAKTKRLERIRLECRKSKTSKIESRGFDKRLRRRMDGTVEVRT